MKSAAWILPLLLAAAPLPQAPPYADPVYGFTIQPPKFPAASARVGVTPVMFFAPAENGFAGNLNVAVQSTDKTLQEYAELSRGQFEQLKLTLVSEKPLKVSGRDALLWEYEGKMQGRDLHWLALAVPDKGRVYLATCTATPEGFLRNEKAFRAALQSFSLPE